MHLTDAKRMLNGHNAKTECVEPINMLISAQKELCINEFVYSFI